MKVALLDPTGITTFGGTVAESLLELNVMVMLPPATPVASPSR